MRRSEGVEVEGCGLGLGSCGEEGRVWMCGWEGKAFGLEWDGMRWGGWIEEEVSLRYRCLGIG
jgi:hypothetical protein